MKRWIVAMVPASLGTWLIVYVCTSKENVNVPFGVGLGSLLILVPLLLALDWWLAGLAIGTFLGAGVWIDGIVESDSGWLMVGYILCVLWGAGAVSIWLLWPIWVERRTARQGKPPGRH